MLISLCKRTFSAPFYPNTPTVASEVIGDREYIYDQFFRDYSTPIRAFLERRRVRKSEVCNFTRANGICSKADQRDSSVSSKTEVTTRDTIVE